MRMSLRALSKPLSSILKLRKFWYLTVMAMITVGLSAQISPAVSDLPSNQQVITFLTESIDWYRHCAFERQIATEPLDLVFLAAAELLKVPITSSIVVGDSVWDLLAARRAGALGVGLLSGGYGREELERAGAYRVYNDPADLLRHLDEMGVRTEG